MLLNGNVERVEIPHEPDCWFEFRTLRRKDIAKAREIQEHREYARLREMGGELVRAFQEEARMRAADPQGAAAVEADPLAAYDLDTLLVAGIAGWSYATEGGKAVRVTPDNIGELDQETAVWAGREILARAGVLPKAAAEAARKNA